VAKIQSAFKTRVGVIVDVPWHKDQLESDKDMIHHFFAFKQAVRRMFDCICGPDKHELRLYSEMHPAKQI